MGSGSFASEQVHVGVRRAFDALHGRTPTATFEGVRRLDAIDYREAGVGIQSKYINGLRDTLEHVLEHAEQYPDFARGEGRYHIPRDQAEQLAQLQQVGKMDGLVEGSARTIQRKLDMLQRATGRSPDALIEPGEATYAEVQKGSVHETIESREQKLQRENEELKSDARAEHGPSLAGMAQAAAMGAAAGGGVRLAQALWVKARAGRNAFKGQFSADDWRDVGVDVAQGVGGGAVAGGMLYVVTNATDLAAPFAGALVSGVMGVGELRVQYRAGAIDGEQFVQMSQIVASDAAIVGLASAVGQAMIPVPVVGAFVGSLAGKLTAAALVHTLGKKESELLERLEAYERWALEQLDAESRTLHAQLDIHFENLERLTAAAFDETINTTLRLEASIRLAAAVRVDPCWIIRTPDDLDAFMSA